MFTIFACPKEFKNAAIETIQKNSIKSWMLLSPFAEVILLGDDYGVGEISKEYNLKHIAIVDKSKLGTPLINSIFASVESEAKNNILCYVNSDIILTSEIISPIKIAIKKFDNCFVLVSRRWDIKIKKELDFNKDWEKELVNQVHEKGILQSPSAIDCFIFPKGLFKEIPPFIVGRPRWDNWFIWNALKHCIPVIDITSVVHIIHQNHDFSHIKQKGFKQTMNPEWKINEEIIGANWPIYMCNIWDSNYALKKGQIKKSFFLKKIDSVIDRYLSFVTLVLKSWHPYFLPIYFFWKGLYILFNILRSILHRIVK